MNNGEARCIAFGGTRLDARISEEILRVVEPGAIDAALVAADRASTSHDELVSALELDLKEARYVADRARTRYEAVDPLNRLVAEELETRWNAALTRVGELAQRIEVERARRRPQGAAKREEFLHLAHDLAAIWNDASTDVRLKKRIVRAVINEIVVDVDDAANEVLLTIHWVGGAHTELRVQRQKRGVSSRRAPESIVEAVRILARVCGDELIAGLLNKNGHSTGSGDRWTQGRVAGLRWRHEIAIHRSTRDAADWMTLKSAAEELGVAPLTLRRAAERGEIAADHPLANGPWVFDRKSLERLGPITGARRGGKPLPGQLTLGISDT
jgi:hypothetical protein